MTACELLIVLGDRREGGGQGRIQETKEGEGGCQGRKLATQEGLVIISILDVSHTLLNNFIDIFCKKIPNPPGVFYPPPPPLLRYYSTKRWG